MQISKNRHIMILYYLARNAEFATAETLAHFSQSSTRTVKDDIPYLNKQLKEENIGEIEAIKGKGYRLHSFGGTEYDEFYTRINVLYSMFHNRSIESINRSLYILKRLLMDEYVLIDDLAEELYLSRSAIRNDMTWAIRFLESYHIEAKIVANKGYHTEGKEQDIRSALVELRCSQYHEFQPLFPYQKFDDEFRINNKNYYSDLRKAFLDVLRSTRITIFDIATKKVTSHICLMANRIKEGKLVQIDEKMADEIRATYDYEVAKLVFADKTIKSYVEPPEIEIVNFARLLLINRDIDMRVNGIDDLPLDLVKENLKLFNEILDDMSNSFAAKIHKTDLFKVYERDFESLMLQMYLKYHFDYTGKIRLVTYTEEDDTLFSPIPFELTRALISRLQLRLKTPIRDQLVSSFAALYERMLKKVTYPYRKQRLAVTSTEGLVYSKHLAESMKELYGQYIQSIDVFNLYEMRKIRFEDYDALAHSGFILYYNYPLPLINLRELDYEKGNNDFFENIFRKGYDLSEIESIKKTMTIHTDTNIKDIDSFVEALSYRYGKDDKSQKILYDQYKDNEQIINHYYARNGIMLLFMPYVLTGRDVFDIYIPAHTVYYGQDMEMKAMIAVTIDNKISLPDMKILDHVLRYIAQVDGTIEDLLEDKDGTLERIFVGIIRRSFYNR